MSAPIPEAAVEAARLALHDMPGIECDHIDGKTPCCERDARAAVAAALPALRAEVLAPVVALADEADSESESMGMARPPWRSRVWTSDLRVVVADPDAVTS